MRKISPWLAIAALLLSTAVSAQRTMTGGDGICRMSYFTCPAMGNMRFPVFVAKYQDVGLSDTDENVLQHFDDFFNKQGYDSNGATGSVRDYFVTASAGRFVPQFDVLGVVQLENDRAYYGDGEGTAAGHPEDMVIECVKAMDGRVDFSPYDSNGDGYVDNVIVVFAGNAERFGTGNVAVLPTSFMIHFNKYGEDGFTHGYEQGGIRFDSYTVTSELAYGKYDGLGTFLHEFSHALGLADEYNLYDSKSTYTPKKYDLMDIGMYNNDSRTPPTYSAFERFAMGWIDLEVIDGACELQLDPLDTSNKGYIVPVSANEFFVIENRQKQGWDTYMPTHGLMVWHIDYDHDAWYENLANYYKEHQRIALLRPIDGRLTLTPWNTDSQSLTITDIEVANGCVTAKISVSTGIKPLQADAGADTQLFDLAGRRATSYMAGIGIEVVNNSLPSTQSNSADGRKSGRLLVQKGQR